MEQIAQECSRDFDEFYQAQQAQSRQAEGVGNILVISVDGKGVVMRQEDLRPNTKKRAAGQKQLQTRLTKGEKRNSKRMATVAAVYTVNPFIRKAKQIVNTPKSAKIKRPRPEGKRVWASLTKET